MIALLEAHRAGLFGREHLWRNVTAGLVVGVVALPLVMAFAIGSGAKPEQGLYTAIIAGLAAALFGGTRVHISGPAADDLEHTPMGVSSFVLRLGAVPFMDATGMRALEKVVQRFQRRGARVLLCGMNARVTDSLQRAGLLELVGPENVCRNLGEVAARLQTPWRAFRCRWPPAAGATSARTGW